MPKKTPTDLLAAKLKVFLALRKFNWHQTSLTDQDRRYWQEGCGFALPDQPTDQGQGTYLDENLKLAILPKMGGGIHVDTAGVECAAFPIMQLRDNEALSMS